MAMKLQFVGFVPNTNCTTWLLEDQTYVGTVSFDIVDNDFTAMPLGFLVTNVRGGNVGYDVNPSENFL
jgi:hypothetical protein